MIILHNPNLISWSTCRTYRHKQETGSKSIEKAEAGAHPLRASWSGYLLECSGFLPSRILRACSGISAGAGRNPAMDLL